MNFKKWAVVCTSITILALWITSPNADPDNRNHTLEKPNPSISRSEKPFLKGFFY
ncbi:phosphatase [Bacillus sp. 4A_MP2]